LHKKVTLEQEIRYNNKRERDMTKAEVKDQIQIDLCTFLECIGIEDNQILDEVCQIVVQNFAKLEDKKS
jgi:Zn/Cd-binding protein ZinT